MSISSRLAVGNPSPAPRPAPWVDDAADPVGPAEEPGGLVGPALGQAAADPRRRDEVAVDGGRLDDLEAEPGLGAPAGQERRRRRPGRGRRRSSAPRPSPSPRTGRRSPGRRTRGPSARAARGRSGRRRPRSPRPASSSSTLRSVQTSGAGAFSGRRRATGWGSNVRATAGAPAASALARSRPIRCEWPRWTPSKLPTARKAPRSPRGDLREVVERDHRPVSPASTRSGLGPTALGRPPARGRIIAAARRRGQCRRRRPRCPAAAATGYDGGSGRAGDRPDPRRRDATDELPDPGRRARGTRLGRGDRRERRAPGRRGLSRASRLADVPPSRDLDDALADGGRRGGGRRRRRPSSAPRRSGGSPPRACRPICLHPPGPDSEAYYQVAMSREETGAVLVPDLPARLHPGRRGRPRRPWTARSSGPFRGLRYEAPVGPAAGDLVRHEFARAVDLVRVAPRRDRGRDRDRRPARRAPDREPGRPPPRRRVAPGRGPALVGPARARPAGPRRRLGDA